MIDLRSDTLTLPSKEMLDTILTAKSGDDGRVGPSGRGEDETVNELEDIAAGLTGKEAALLAPSGTFGNTVAILSMCDPGDSILVDERQHILISEKILFDEKYGRLKPIKYKLTENMTPDIEMIDKLLGESGAKLICIENTHNYAGGYFIPVEEMKKIRMIADRHGAKIHLDGARLFHAAAGLKVEIEDITQHVDSVMFSISKGLGAPVGSLVCGTQEMIKKARELRKLLGGGMRQAAIIAAPGIYALKNNVGRLHEDIDNAKHVFNKLNGKLTRIIMQKEVQTNILKLQLSDTAVSPSKFCSMAAEKGLVIGPVSTDSVRLVFYKGIDAAAAEEAAEIILALDKII
ncbi:threonine aldolase family protein [Planococcus shenhongbingii]|uniref:GntG family PLP-dependent aldolase n=1 Tax=Planococcus shenhongbingii TaxID=3058398 RepID=A0ABT8NC91_9BACL|nr:GntG family PLP-dependent aldolase [Planococcus sp. N017]MDN7245478.1 GntG family PLP-dependent aldolase [Planococcus sp. N017]